MNRYRLATTLSPKTLGPSGVDQRRLNARVTSVFQAIFLFALAHLCLSTTVAHSQSSNESDTTPPNVVLILADDLGYGDVQALNPRSAIPTPNFNRLAKEGITFTDAHTPSSVCTPTRYGLLTGRYCWRTELKRGVLNGYSQPLIESDRATLASMFKEAGYQTAVIGKWHLGLGIQGDANNLDLNQSLTFHPGNHGFDHSLVIPASLDFPPYVYFKNGEPTTDRWVEQKAIRFPGFTRQGQRAEDFKLRDCLDHLTDETISVIREMKTNGKPTFLYFPLTAPHKPVLPNQLFAGSTAYGPYGDFLRQVDHTVGRVIDALEANEHLENTLLIVTSDNGSFMKRIDPSNKDHISDETVQGFHISHHQANANWRGTKADIWEAGHRVPFFVRLPNAKNAGKRVTQVIGLVDIMATLAEHLAIELPATSAPDSYSFAKLLNEPSSTFARPALVCHSAGGMFAIREGQWKLIAGNGSGGREHPKGTPFGEPWMLVNLELDPSETKNLAERHPEIVNRLRKQLDEIKGDD
ncbi:MAG: arylsulfatase [Rubripirellula sp.]|nr:arylsulfatase [Rubripirellula sp.]